jgi:hypothetical protein
LGLREIVWRFLVWIHVALDREQWRTLMNTLMNIWVTEKAKNFLTGWATVSFAGKTLLHGGLCTHL